MSKLSPIQVATQVDTDSTDDNTSRYICLENNSLLSFVFPDTDQIAVGEQVLLNSIGDGNVDFDYNGLTSLSDLTGIDAGGLAVAVKSGPGEWAVFEAAATESGYQETDAFDQVMLALGPTAYWNFREESGTEAEDKWSTTTVRQDALAQ